MVFKPTGFGRLDLYTEVTAGKELHQFRKRRMAKSENSLRRSLSVSFEKNVILMVDAEENLDARRCR